MDVGINVKPNSAGPLPVTPNNAGSLPDITVNEPNGASGRGTQTEASPFWNNIADSINGFWDTFFSDPDRNPNGYVSTEYLREGPRESEMLFPSEENPPTPFNPVSRPEGNGNGYIPTDFLRENPSLDSTLLPSGEEMLFPSEDNPPTPFKIADTSSTTKNQEKGGSGNLQTMVDLQNGKTSYDQIYDKYVADHFSSMYNR